MEESSGIRRGKIVAGILACVLIFAAGLAIGAYKIAPDNGRPIEGEVLSPGKYYKLYPDGYPLEEFLRQRYCNTSLTDEEKKNSFMFVVVISEKGEILLVRFPSDKTEDKLIHPRERPYVEVTSKNGRKTFVYANAICWGAPN